ncbi:hypothetical protein T265_00700 [Opisthorchis viverrini]|uniref:Uncharacterized protein n=1 Tax=Opisthorchis viverrini TaxID=6198 RepID=A0A075ABY4_OPIVI|nr:hypothetical protein T265_00700 [Opisthorchis viverrini]KER33380.1 hypothetical protein T265_00700 [Opisthorchis viverrini]
MKVYRGNTLEEHYKQEIQLGSRQMDVNLPGESQERAKLKHEAAWCSTFSCLRKSQTRDSAGFQANSSPSVTAQVSRLDRYFIHSRL